MIIPYQVDVPMERRPFANYLLIAFTVVCSIALLVQAWTGGLDGGAERWLLIGWRVPGLFTHIFLHAGIIHLIGNMLFLWVFGNAVCAKTGNLAYPFVYLALGLAAAGVHVLSGGGPAIGASGAINGVVGMFLVFFPQNDISCAWVVFPIRGGTGTFSVSSYVMIVLWLIFDIWGAVRGGGGVAYWAHIGGFAAGFGLAALLLKTGRITMTRYERSLLDLFAGRG
jgi:membrane associated rhomboid family serine protease